MVLLAPECTSRFHRCVFALDISTKESVVMLAATYFSSPRFHLSLAGKVWVLLVLGIASVHYFWACFVVDLLALLKWKAFPDRIMDILGRLRHVSGEEIVKVCLPIIHRCYLSKNLGRRSYITLISTSIPLRPFLKI